MTKYRVSVSANGRMLFDDSYESDNQFEALCDAVEDFKIRPEVADATTFDINIRVDGERS